MSRTVFCRRSSSPYPSMRHIASLARTKRPSSDPTTNPTAVCPKSARNRTSPPGTATSLSVRGIDDMDTGPSGRSARRPLKGDLRQSYTEWRSLYRTRRPASPAQRFVQHPCQTDACLSALDLDHGRRLVVIGLAERNHPRDLAPARSSRRERRICEIPGDRVALGDPAGNRALFPGGLVPLIWGRRHEGALAAAPGDEPAHHVHVPDGVQVEAAVGRVVALPEERHLNGVAAPIAPIRGVKRLMDVTHQMHDPLESPVPLRKPRALVAEDPELPVQLRRSALSVPAIPGVVRRSAERDIVEMQAASRFFRIVFPDFIRPGSDLAERAPARELAVRQPVVLQEIADARACFRVKMPARDVADHAVGFRPPGKSASRQRKREQSAKYPRAQQEIAAPVTAAESRCRA